MASAQSLPNFKSNNSSCLTHPTYTNLCADQAEHSNKFCVDGSHNNAVDSSLVRETQSCELLNLEHEEAAFFVFISESDSLIANVCTTACLSYHLQHLFADK